MEFLSALFVFFIMVTVDVTEEVKVPGQRRVTLAEEDESPWVPYQDPRKPPNPNPEAGPEPGDAASGFSVPTLDGKFSYKPGVLNGSLLIHAFTNKSAFLECLWSSEVSLTSLVEGFPDSSQLLVVSLDDSAVTDVLWMREQLQRAAMRR